MLKLLKNEPKVKVSPSPDFKLKEVGIFLWERDPNIHKYVATPPEECPVCGNSKFELGKQLSATLNPRFGGGFRYLMWVYVHPECFDDCIETSEPEPTAW